jgi:hypothetical protein
VEGQRRVGGDSAAHPDLAIAAKRIAITWKEFDGERSLLKAMLSEDDGDTWKETQLMATAGASAQPLLLVNADRFYVFWNTRQEPLSVRALP